ncbi:MAG: class I SAM-dependent methyltransferase [Leptospiraceae bacterium]|nr:class I SAM-dependent methyltransferase [Leptospiraceae bacterium]
MNITLEDNSIQEQVITKNFYRSLVISSLDEMKAGTLCLIEPDGTIITLGGGKLESTNYYNSGFIKIHSFDFYRRCVLYGDIGFAESYMEELWDTDDLSKVLSWFLLNIDNNPSLSGSKMKNIGINLLKGINLLLHRFRENSIKGSKKNIVAHYDLGNDFYSLFLDKTMTYSSAIFKTYKEDLEEAQIAKYSSLAESLQLKPNMHILEIGSGWGGFSQFLVKEYACKVHTVTISDEQYKYVKNIIEQEGLKGKLTVELSDYRLLKGSYDRIVSIEMLEAVGDKYYETYFKKCHELLKKDGLLGIQVITSPDSRYEEIKKGVDFIQKYIFPGSLIPSLARLNKAINKTGDLFMHNLLDMGLSYAHTLRLWKENFNRKLEDVRTLGFDEKFIRMWNYYLSYCEVAFQMRNITVVQAVYTRPNNLSLG